MLTIEDFKKVEMIVVEIKEAALHPNADRLFVLKVDTGEEIRPLVAGIRSSYAPEDLIGRRAIIVKNLEPATIRGEESRGMILAVSDEEGVSILTPDRNVALGSQVR